MQKTNVIQAIHTILEQELYIPNIAAFSENARLNEDLYLDSVLLLQLLISLELQLGIKVPDSALSNEDFATVSSLAEFLLRQQQTQVTDLQATEAGKTEASAEQEEFEDIKVHCFVSCLCQMVKADDRVDHRPFYFGVWDADVVIDDNHCISYHSEDLSHDFFKHWYEKLYGAPITPWYNHHATKEENINTLLELLNNKTDTQNIMVMLDMFRLPERENKFNQNPFPHYVMLEKTADPDTWFMWDPDFRWEGTQQKNQVLHAIESEAVAGGYYFDSKDIQPTSDQNIHDYFIACLKNNHNPMTDCVRTIINAHMADDNNLSPGNLTEALTQLPVLAIRKYAYEHGLAFFWRELNLSDDEFEDWCVVVEELVSTYKQIQFRAMKIAANHDKGFSEPSLLTEIDTLLNQQNEREFRIKSRLQDVFQQWCQQKGFEQNTAAKVKEVCL